MQETGNNINTKWRRLAIRIGRQSLSFSVSDTQAESQIVYEPYIVKSGISMAANLREAFRTYEFLDTNWRSVQVLIDSPVLMIPVEEFSEDSFEELYHHTIMGKDNDAILKQVIPALNVVAVFSVNKDLKLVIEDRFQGVRFSHVCTPVWTHLYRRSFTGTRRKLFGYFHDRQLCIFCYHQNRFRFCNSFDVANVKDATYFLLYVWQQLAFDQRKDELHLCGEVLEREELLTELHRFLQNAYVINPTADFNRAPVTQVKGMPYDLTTYYVKGIR